MVSQAVLNDAPLLTVGSIFSGVEGFGLGLARAGMRVLWQIENDPACCRVLARHWPEVRRFGDVREVQGDELDAVDLVCGGSPCTDLSVAGKRAGLAGERSGLFFEFVRIVDAVAPRWLLFENVDGLLSSRHGDDFATVLECLTGFRPRVPQGGWRNSGACWGLKRSACWRVLDCEYDGLAQRRNRVFLVASARNRTDPLQVLLEPESCTWDPSPCRETRASLAASIAPGTHPPGLSGDEAVTQLIAASITSGSASPGIQRPGRRREDDINLVYQCQGSNVGPMGTLRSGNGHVTGGVPFTVHALMANYGKQPDNSDRNGGPPNLLVSHTLRLEGADASEDGTGSGVPLVVAFDWQTGAPAHGKGRCYGVRAGPYAGAVGASKHDAVAIGMAVRRLMPRECERLFGIPDDYTAYDAEGNGISDSARYRILGNSLSVPTVAWIGRRIVAVHREVAPCR